jgi:putative phosphoesterase
MKALILSDIHANIHALNAIWEHEQDSDAIYCTGDLVDYGPCPREVISWVREHDVVCTQGNHDAWVAMTYRSGLFPHRLPPEEREWRHHNAGLLQEHEIAFLEGLPPAVEFELDGVRYGMVHLYANYNIITSVHAYRGFCATTFDHDEPIERLIMGHTHRQVVYYLRDDLLWLNPGSASYRRPDDPDQTAHYATITDGRITLKQLVYDHSAVFRQVAQVELKESESTVTRWFFGPRTA